MHQLSDFSVFLQGSLFPALEQEAGPLSVLDRQFMEVIALAEFERFEAEFAWLGHGRPPSERLWLMHAFAAKSVYQFPTTSALIHALRSQPTLRRLCGFAHAGEVPSESTFSRAFDEFAGSQLAQRVHERIILTHAKPKLVGHLSRDATAIEAPEKPVPKPPEPQPERRKRGRPAKDEVRQPPPPKRLDEQLLRPLEANIAELPCFCTVGTKRNSAGYKESWIGYKLHLDVADGDVPVSALLTTASLHDSQAAIPLGQMSAARVSSLYDLMDSAYDAPQIVDFSRSLGHVPIIDHNPRRGPKREFEPAHERRYCERSSAERVNSLLKCRYGGRWVRVRGAAKVMCHLMFGVVALTVASLMARLC